MLLVNTFPTDCKQLQYSLPLKSPSEIQTSDVVFTWVQHYTVTQTHSSTSVKPFTVQGFIWFNLVFIFL